MADIPFKSLSVIVPFFNEYGNVGRIKEELIPYFRSLPCPCEFIFVDDGSTDETYSALSAVQSQNPSLKLVRHETNQGLGMALRSGLKEASAEAIVILDADLTFYPSQFDELLQAYSSEWDCVMGSPILGAFESVNWVRRLLSRAVNGVYQVLLGKKLTSTSSIFRLYRSDVIKLLSLRCHAFDINSEILAKMVFSGARVTEVPVTLGRRSWGVSKIDIPREIWNHLLMFGRILRWRLAGKTL